SVPHALDSAAEDDKRSLQSDFVIDHHAAKSGKDDAEKDKTIYTMRAAIAVTAAFFLICLCLSYYLIRQPTKSTHQTKHLDESPSDAKEVNIAGGELPESSRVSNEQGRYAKEDEATIVSRLPLGFTPSESLRLSAKQKARQCYLLGDHDA